MAQELTRIFTAQITMIGKEKECGFRPKEEAEAFMVNTLKLATGADDVVVTAQDFIMESGANGDRDDAENR